MSSAASFHLTFHPARRDRLLLTLWVALSLSVFAVWLTSHGWSAWFPAARPHWLTPLVALMACLAAAGWTWWRCRLEVISIGWHDGTWHLAECGDPARRHSGRVEPMVDLGGWMLLRFRASGSKFKRWFVADAARAGPDWHALRAALYRTAQVGVPPA